MVIFSNNDLVSSQGTDQTIQPEASGSVVVKATLSRLDISQNLTDTTEFMRRLAYVESRDGLDTDTYREDYHGGIWKVCDCCKTKFIKGNLVISMETSLCTLKGAPYRLLSSYFVKITQHLNFNLYLIT